MFSCIFIETQYVKEKTQPQQMLLSYNVTALAYHCNIIIYYYIGTEICTYDGKGKLCNIRISLRDFESEKTLIFKLMLGCRY